MSAMTARQEYLATYMLREYFHLGTSERAAGLEFPAPLEAVITSTGGQSYKITGYAATKLKELAHIEGDATP